MPPRGSSPVARRAVSLPWRGLVARSPLKCMARNARWNFPNKIHHAVSMQDSYWCGVRPRHRARPPPAAQCCVQEQTAPPGLRVSFARWGEEGGADGGWRDVRFSGPPCARCPKPPASQLRAAQYLLRAATSRPLRVRNREPYYSARGTMHWALGTCLGELLHTPIIPRAPSWPSRLRRQRAANAPPTRRLRAAYVPPTCRLRAAHYLLRAATFRIRRLPVPNSSRSARSGT